MHDPVTPSPSSPFSGACLSYLTHVFLFDVDGTLVDLQPRPDMVHAPEALVGHLAQLGELTDGAVMAITGRQLSFVDGLFAPLRLAGAGIHGLELRREAGAPVIRHSDGALLDEARELAGAFALERQGLELEDKGLSIALHYRAAPAREAEVGGFMARLAALQPGQLMLQQGKLVTELRLAGLDKGGAVTELLQGPAHAGRTPVFFGDDITDESAFAAVQALGGLGVLVAADDRPSHAKGRLPSPAAVRRVIERLARREAVFIKGPVSLQDGGTSSTLAALSR